MFDLKIPPLVQVIIVVILMYFISIFVPGFNFSSVYSEWLAILFFVAAIYFFLSGVKEFSSAKTTVNPMHPDRTTSLIVVGVYKFSRNPMYFSFLLALIAWGIFLGSIPALTTTPLFMWYITKFQIVPEERVLENKFGTHFSEYKSRVRRWI